MSQPLPIRTETLARLDAFTPCMGRHYAARRSHDLGPGRYQSVSGLSPWIRHRLLTEQDVVAGAVEAHGAGTENSCRKLSAAVISSVSRAGWNSARDLAATAHDPDPTARIEAVETSRTGIACTDARVQD